MKRTRLSRILQDYVKRLPAPKFQEWKDIETQVEQTTAGPGRPMCDTVARAGKGEGAPWASHINAFL